MSVPRIRSSRSILAALPLLLLALPTFAQELFPPLQTEGLGNGTLMRNIYRGHFERMPAQDDSTMTNVSDEGYVGRKALMAYVTAFSDQCFEHLSPRKQEIRITIISYTQRQDMWMTRFGPIYGAQHTEETGRREESAGFAEPEFYDAFIALFNETKKDALVVMFRDLMAKNADSFGGAGLKLIYEVLELNVEIRALIARHGCTSPQTRTFARNLLRYAQGRSPELREPTFLVQCRANIAAFVPGASPAKCTCVEGAMRKRLAVWKFAELEDDFTEERFLLSTARKVGQAADTARCLQ